MVTRVLVAVDGSEMSEAALRYALDVHAGADITVLVVVGEPSPMMGGPTAIATADDPREKTRELAEPILERAHEIAGGHDTEIDTAVGFGHPAREIVNRADGFDTVVLGSHGGSMSDRLIVGNVAETVFNRSSVPVAVVR